MEHCFHEVEVESFTSETLTLAYFYEKLERYESIILELPNGETRKYTYYSFLSKSDGALPIAKPRIYDRLSSTYYLKTLSQEECISNNIKRILHEEDARVIKELTEWSRTERSRIVRGEKRIKKITHNGLATIIFWNDETKTVVKCENQEEYDLEKGILYAALKKLATKKEYDDILRTIDIETQKSNMIDKIRDKLSRLDAVSERRQI